MLSDPQRRRLDAWILEIAPRAVAYAASLLRDRSSAEDIVQDCLYRLLRKAAVYDLERDGNRLLFAAISNACINQNTRQRTLASLSGAADERDLDPIDPATVDPAVSVLTQELRAAIGNAMRQLPEMQRAALELRSLGYGKHEIAQMLDLTPSHAGVLVHRARRRLLELLGPVFGEELE
jgi:RNA polymerase sigma factor (sigma-70 family)